MSFSVCPRCLRQRTPFNPEKVASFIENLLAARAPAFKERYGFDLPYKVAVESPTSVSIETKGPNGLMGMQVSLSLKNFAAFKDSLTDTSPDLPDMVAQSLKQNNVSTAEMAAIIRETVNCCNIALEWSLALRDLTEDDLLYGAHS